MRRTIILCGNTKPPYTVFPGVELRVATEDNSGINAHGPGERWQIADAGGWMLYLNEDQGLLGRCYLMLKRLETDVTALTDTELSELWATTRKVRKALDTLWSPDHYNYAFLMNQTPQVHWHIIPRYEEPREFAGDTFEDPHFGGHYPIDRPYLLDAPTYESVIKAIRQQL